MTGSMATEPGGLSVSISKAFGFSASHVLRGLPPDHKCTRLHGHSYDVRIELWGQVDVNGFIMDFGDLDWVADLLRTRLDHRHLNDVLDFNPTAELISGWIADQVSEWLDRRPESGRIDLFAVGVSEGRRSWATTRQARSF